MANKPTSQDIERVAREFLGRLKYPSQKGPKQQYAIFIGGFPGSGKTTAAREFADEAGNCFHVQANDARVLLTEMGDFEWGINVKEVLKQITQELFAEGHSLILDGAFIEEREKSLRESLIRKFALRSLSVAVNCPLRIAETRARQRYADGKKSEFGDWRTSDVDKYIASMPERKEKLEGLLYAYPEMKMIVNDGSTDDLDRQAHQIWSKF